MQTFTQSSVTVLPIEETRMVVLVSDGAEQQIGVSRLAQLLRESIEKAGVQVFNHLLRARSLVPEAFRKEHEQADGFEFGTDQCTISRNSRINATPMNEPNAYVASAPECTRLTLRASA